MVNLKDFKYDNHFDGEYEIVDGLINVVGNFKLIKKVSKLPFQFGKVDGYFLCSDCRLNTLVGCPKYVGLNFSCTNNRFTSLIGGPIHVSGNYACYDNRNLISLDGAPEYTETFCCDWIANLPMLRILKYTNFVIFENRQFEDIFQKYLNKKPFKKAILDCQKELIENGFVGNASW
jgi:hypothetical protein